MTTQSVFQNSNPAASNSVESSPPQSCGGVSVLESKKKILSGLLNKYGEQADYWSELYMFGPKKYERFNKSEANKYNKLFIGVAERILWLITH